MSENRRAMAAAVVVGAVFLAVVSLVAVSPAIAQFESGEPNINVYLSDNEVTPGTAEQITLEIENDAELRAGSGEQVLPARALSVEIEDAGPFESSGGEMPLGTLPDGEVIEAPQQLDVPDDVEPGEHDVTIRVRYAYTDRVSGDTQQRLTSSETHDVTVVVPEEPRFDVTHVSTTVEPGASGSATLEIENTGPVSANETRATITGDGGVVVDGGAATDVLGDLESGQSTTTTIDVAIDESASAGEKPLDLEFVYRDHNGIQTEAPAETATLAPAGEQSFSIENVAETLAVGYDGTVTGDVRNDGPGSVDDAVLVVEPMSDSMHISDTRYALPDLDAGETAAFRYPTDVSGQADPGDRQLRFTVEYTGGDDTPLEGGPMSERVTVDAQRDEFSIGDDVPTVRQGETSEFTLEITNERPEPLSNIDAMLYTRGDIDTDNDEAFVHELEPGESAELRFDVTVAEDAAVETHPIELDFQYDTDRGETTLSDTYQYPLAVEHAEGDGGTITGTIVGVLGALAVAGVGVAVWWRRG